MARASIQPSITPLAHQRARAALLAIAIALGSAVRLGAQATQSHDTISINPDGFPLEIRQAYGVFRQKCGGCHGLDTSLQPRLSASQWTNEVRKMQAMASAQFSDRQATAIVDFLNYDETHRKSLSATQTQSTDSGSTSAGEKFYATHGCSNCHALGGKGGTSAPPLNDVGKRLSATKLAAVIQAMRNGTSSMPPLPPETTDQQVQELIQFLENPGGQEKKQDAKATNRVADVATKEPAVTAKESPVVADSSPGTSPGEAFYAAQGCAKCHSIGGKGGTAGPSLTGVGKRLSKEELTAVFEKMRTGKSSMPPLPAETTDEQVRKLVAFLIGAGDQAAKPGAAPSQSTLVAVKRESSTHASGGEKLSTGRQFYASHGCATCHAIGGKGGKSAPSLNDVGKRLSTEQLTAIIQSMRTGKSSMPPLPPETTDQEAKALVRFLASNGDATTENSAGMRKGSEAGSSDSTNQIRAPSSAPLAVATPDRDATNDGFFPGTLALLALLALTVGLVIMLVLRPTMTATEGGKVLAFFALFIFPVMCVWIGTTYHINRSKSTKFCLSCHEMEPFGKSLLVDGSPRLAAAHFQNHRVPADEACYTCHANYAMFGGFRAKMQGLRHIYVHYVGTPPAPTDIRLYTPYNNRECLHCHLGARSFEEGKTHNAAPYLLPALKGNQVSCLSSGCHSMVHNVGDLKGAKFWKSNLP